MDLSKGLNSTGTIKVLFVQVNDQQVSFDVFLECVIDRWRSNYFIWYQCNNKSRVFIVG